MAFNWNAIPGLFAAGAGGLLVNEAYDRLGGIGDRAFQYNDATGEFGGPTAAIANASRDGSQFKPFGVTSSLGNIGVGADGTTNYNLTPQQLAQQNQMANYSQGLFSQSMQGLGPREAEVYERIRATQRPGEERAALELENRLMGQGRLGVTTAAYGGTPEQLAMAKAQAEARNSASLGAIGQAQAEQLQQANIGSQYMTNQYLPQASLLATMNPALQAAGLADVGRRQSAGMYADALMGGLETSLASRMGQANLMGNLGSGLISGAFAPNANNPLYNLFLPDENIMARFSRALTAALMNPSFQQGLFTAGNNVGAYGTGRAAVQENQRMDAAQASMMAQAAQGPQDKPQQLMQSILATAGQTGADPSQAMAALQARNSLAEKQRAQQNTSREARGQETLTRLAATPTFDITNPKHKQAFYGIASSYNLSAEQASGILDSVVGDFGNPRDNYMVAGNDIFDSESGKWIPKPAEEPSAPEAQEPMKQKDIAGLYEKFTPDSISEFIKDPTKPLVPLSNPVDIKEEDTAQRKLVADIAKTDNVIRTVQEARTLADDQWALFYKAGELPLPTDARRLNNLVTTMQSNLGFDRLQEMRDNSPTGGALGQVSNLENRLLQSVLTALDPSAGDETFNEQLDKVEEHYNNFKRSVMGLPPQGPNYRTKPNGDVLYKDPSSGEVYKIGSVDPGVL